MFGTEARPCLATKAADIGTLLVFCRVLFRRLEHRVGAKGGALVGLGEALVRMRDRMRTQPRILPLETCQELVDCAKRASVLREEAEVAWRPKWHMLLHLASRAFHSGNPNWHQTFLGEHHNGLLAKLAATCHRLTWHARVLSQFRWAYSGVSR